MWYFIVTALMFSLFEVVSKNIQVSPYTLTFIRFFIGGCILMPGAVIKIIKTRQRIKKIHFLWMWLLGILLMLSCILLQIALINTSVSFCVFIYTLNTIFTAFAGWTFLKERPDNIIWLTCFIAFIGIVIMTNPFKGNVNLYSFAALASSILYSVFNTLLFKLAKSYGNLVTTSMCIFMGAISLGTVLALTGTNLVLGVSSANIVQILIIGIICSAGVYIMYYKTMEATSVSIASTVFLIKPVLATVLAVIFLREIPDITFSIGACIVLTGVAISLYKKIKMSLNIQSRQIPDREKGETS